MAQSAAGGVGFGAGTLKHCIIYADLALIMPNQALPLEVVLSGRYSNSKVLSLQSDYL
jgi:hypothetical protein